MQRCVFLLFVVGMSLGVLGTAYAAELDGIEHIALSDDGSLASLADNKGAAHLYDPAKKEVLWSKTVYPASRVAAVMAVEPDGKWLATSGPPNLSVTVWPARPTANEREVKLTDKIAATRLAFSPDGKQLAGCLTDGRVILWSVPQFKEVSVLKNRYGVEALAWSNNGKMVAVATNQQELTVWFPSRNKALIQVKAQMGSFDVSHLAFSPDGRQLLAAGSQRIAVWDVAGGKFLKSIDSVERSERTFGLAWNPTKDLAVDLTNDSIRVFDIAQGKLVRELPADLSPFDACFSRDGTKLLYRERSMKSSALVYRDLGAELDWPSATPARSGSEATPATVRSGSDAATSSAGVVLPELNVEKRKMGQTHLGDEIWRIAAVGAKPAAKPSKPAVSEPVDLRAAITAMGLSDDGKTIVAGGREGQVFVGDFDTGKMRGRFWIANNDRIDLIQPSPDGKMFVAHRANEQQVELWSDKGEPLAVIPTEDEAIRAVFSPRGTYLVLMTDDSVLLFRLADRTFYATLQLNNGLSSLAVSENEELVAVGGVQYVCVWNVQRDRPQWTNKVMELGVTAVAFSPDGKYLAAGDSSAAGYVKICDMEGNIVALHDTSTPIQAIAFQSLDRLVFANAAMKEMIFLSVPDVKPLETSPHPAGGSGSIYDRFALSRNGRRAVWNQQGSATLPELKPWKAK